MCMMNKYKTIYNFTNQNNDCKALNSSCLNSHQCLI